MKKIIGIVGSPERATTVDAVMSRIGATKSLGSIESAARKILFPEVKNGLVGETHIRKLANKLNVQIPVQKYAGRAVENQAEADAFFSTIVAQYAGEGWETTYFLDSDFFRRPDDMYSIVADNKNSAALKRRMDEDYIEVAALDEAEDKPRGVKYSLVVGENQEALEGKVKKLLAQIKKDIKESERK
jgi:hypothetical protein